VIPTLTGEILVPPPESELLSVGSARYPAKLFEVTLRILAVPVEAYEQVVGWNSVCRHFDEEATVRECRDGPDDRIGHLSILAARQYFKQAAILMVGASIASPVQTPSYGKRGPENNGSEDVDSFDDLGSKWSERDRVLQRRLRSLRGFPHRRRKRARVARLSIEGAEFWVADESPEHLNLSPESLGGGTARMVMIVNDPDASFERALRAGATVVRPVCSDYGWRSVTDTSIPPLVATRNSTTPAESYRGMKEERSFSLKALWTSQFA
jgi:hypothetical protein